MSHIVQIRTEIRDAEAVRAACKRLNLDEPVQGTARLDEGEVSGLLVRLRADGGRPSCHPSAGRSSAPTRSGVRPWKLRRRGWRRTGFLLLNGWEPIRDLEA